MYGQSRTDKSTSGKGWTSVHTPDLHWMMRGQWNPINCHGWGNWHLAFGTHTLPEGNQEPTTKKPSMDDTWRIRAKRSQGNVLQTAHWVIHSNEVVLRLGALLLQDSIESEVVEPIIDLKCARLLPYID